MSPRHSIDTDQRPGRCEAEHAAKQQARVGRLAVTRPVGNPEAGQARRRNGSVDCDWYRNRTESVVLRTLSDFAGVLEIPEMTRGATRLVDVGLLLGDPKHPVLARPFRGMKDYGIQRAQ